MEVNGTETFPFSKGSLPWPTMERHVLDICEGKQSYIKLPQMFNQFQLELENEHPLKNILKDFRFFSRGNCCPFNNQLLMMNNFKNILIINITLT